MCGGWWATADLLETLGRISKREGVTFRSLCHPANHLSVIPEVKRVVIPKPLGWKLLDNQLFHESDRGHHLVVWSGLNGLVAEDRPDTAIQ